MAAKNGFAERRTGFRLPKRFPVGTTYVVEGQGGEHGQLLVSSRYVVLPGGQRIEIAGQGKSVQPVRAGAGLAVPAFSGSGLDVG